jgi:peptidoglycan/LPS O-acetylase OafA/YrhL
MNLDPVWAYFVLMTVVVGIAALPLFRFIDNAPNPGARYSTIDGLRGFLALAVFVFHLLVTHRFIETGIWDVPDSRFYALLGPVGVSLFFMITGFLFWEKMLRAKGRPRWRELYIGRLFRIGPMYLFVVLVMLYIVFTRTGFQLHESADLVAGSVLQWLALGMIDTQPDVNGYRASHVLAGVTWTIWYEWAFYASLMATAVFARGKAHLIFVFAALAACLGGKILLSVDAMGIAVLFLSGMAVASLLHENIRPRISNNVSSTIALACLGVVFATSDSGYGTFSAMLLALFFYLVCSGTSVFGLLTTTPARRLGNISYSLYLMQGLVLTLVFAIAPLRDFAMASPQQYWVASIVCVCVLLLGAALGYALIERPGIALGQRLIRRRTPTTGSPQRGADMKRGASAGTPGSHVPAGEVTAGGIYERRDTGTALKLSQFTGL